MIHIISAAVGIVSALILLALLVQMVLTFEQVREEREGER